MVRILDSLISFFTENDWRTSKVDDTPALQMTFDGNNGQWVCYAQAREEQEQFVFYSICPIRVSQEKRVAMAEFLTRANYGLIIGNFEMDFDDGEIRCKTSIDVEGTELSSLLIEHLVYANVVVMDSYLPGIMAVASGHASPMTAIEQIEEA